ncbi:MAG: tetratricopeptide repeat protein [Candidatus Omnitrophica bacterium]|nr:hypothetical protein [bacterium]NUN96419.1 tetratricopeptide repeat protein [Candidatus Omnitrophota bacterium]
MPRRRLKHKQVVETIKQDDFQVIREQFNDFWQRYFAPYQGILYGALVAVIVLGIGGVAWRNSRLGKIDNANLILSQAKTDFESGDANSALSELNKVLPGGEYSMGGISVAAEMVRANIAFASGEYETAITILHRIIPEAPKSLQADLKYQLATAQENKGDFEGAIQTLDSLAPDLGKEPDASDRDREGSPWDRFYYQKGRVLLKMNQADEGAKLLLKVAKRSPWNGVADAELTWSRVKPVESLPLNWRAPKS